MNVLEAMLAAQGGGTTRQLGRDGSMVDDVLGMLGRFTKS